MKAYKFRDSEILIQTEAETNVEGRVEVDPCMFDEGYTLAGATGFYVWEAAEAFTTLLSGKATGIVPLGNSSPFSREFILSEIESLCSRISQGARIVELGSGTGLAGLAAALLGGRVTLTDLPSLVEHSLKIDVELNSRPSAKDSKYWKIGRGRVECDTLDWTLPVPDRFAHYDIALAADTIWLKDLLEPFVRTASSLSSELWLAYLERAGENSKLFVKKQNVDDTLAQYGWRKAMTFGLRQKGRICVVQKWMK